LNSGELHEQIILVANDPPASEIETLHQPGNHLKTAYVLGIGRAAAGPSSTS
jgi:hypothetical protein